jgi:uncharacterized protein YdhG (YjbR/CyaY superfamily)
MMTEATEENTATYTTIDEYISQFPPAIQEKLEKLSKVIREAAPEAEEKISYRMPTFALHGNLVHFAAFKNHIGVFPTPSGIEAFKGDLSEYKTSKGTIQFPLDKELPFELISRIVKYRVAENTKKAEGKPGKKR